MNQSPSAEATSREALRRLTVKTLALRPRLAYTALLLAGVIASGVVLSLLLGEPSLPWRTRIAFAVMAGIGLSWAAFAAWVLTRRRIALGWHRVIAARMAVAFSSVFALAIVAVALWTPAQARALHALWVGVPLLAVACLELVRARRQHDRLVRRRQELARSFEPGQA
ncbi:MAG TPA: hypothetical protein VNO33_23465 [Kofleriaceae bacterium]|nr:hypothetical protein [Kofleriaceae bacterium]